MTVLMIIVTITIILAMCAHLLTCILVPVIGIWSHDVDVVFELYILLIGVEVFTQVFGWITAILAPILYKAKRFDDLRRSWLILKLGTIPFFIVNFIYSVFAWTLLVVASRGIAIVLVWIPVVVTCSFIVQSGIYGICNAMHLKKTVSLKGTVWHCILQFVPLVDVLDTVLLMKKGKKS